MPELTYPEQTTYFIARNDNGIPSWYGVCNPNQRVTTGLQNLDLYTDFDEFLAELAASGIVYDDGEGD